MFDFDASKILVVGVVALIFIPPKDLPRVLRQVGQFVGKMRRMAAEFQGQFMDAMREADLADLKQEAQRLSEAARASAGLDSLHDLNGQMTSALDRPGAAPAGEPIGRVDTAATAPRAAPAHPAAEHDAPAHEASGHGMSDHGAPERGVPEHEGAVLADHSAHQSA